MNHKRPVRDTEGNFMFAMNRYFAAVILSIPLAASEPVTVGFAQDSSWNGTWTGRWEDNNAISSIIIINGRVQQYRYANQIVPIHQQKNSGNSITFGCSKTCIPYTIVLTRTGPATAAAAFSSPQIKRNRAQFSRN